MQTKKRLTNKDCVKIIDTINELFMQLKIKTRHRTGVNKLNIKSWSIHITPDSKIHISHLWKSIDIEVFYTQEIHFVQWFMYHLYEAEIKGYERHFTTKIDKFGNSTNIFR